MTSAAFPKSGICETACSAAASDFSGKKWEGRYTILRKLGESIEPNAREGGQVRFDYKDGIWKGNPSGYACTINWFVKKMP